MARRHNTVQRADGAPVATAVVDWILTENGEAPVRVPEEFAAAFPTSEGAVAPSTLQESHPPSGSARAPLRIRASDADAMGHANHTVYLDLLDDAVIRAGGAAATAHPRTYDLQYDAAAATGAELCDLAWQEAGLWHYRLETPGGALHLHARLVGASPAASGGA
jgi:acyl-ACP thioesterase